MGAGIYPRSTSLCCDQQTQVRHLLPWMVLAYLRTPRGEHVPSTGIDMVLNDGDTRFEKYAARSRQVTLMEMMHPMLPEMYTVLYSEAQRDPRLLSLSPERIFSVTGLKRKLVTEMPTVAAMAEPALVGAF